MINKKGFNSCQKAENNNITEYWNVHFGDIKGACRDH